LKQHSKRRCRLKRIVIAILLTIAFVIPAIAIAGEGARNLYCAMFNDSSDISDTQFRYLDFVNLANPNNYDAKFKISYYNMDGTKFSNTSSFTHVVPANSKIGFRPNDDLGLNTSNEIKGSYEIDVTDGSLIGVSTHVLKAGTTLPAIGTEYDVGDVITSYITDLETKSYGKLFLHGFSHYGANGSPTEAVNPGDYATWLYINNPDDKITAEIDVYFYKKDGTLQDCNLDNGEKVPVVYTLSPHQTIAVSPANLSPAINGTSTSVGHGIIEIDATRGEVIGYRVTYVCYQDKLVKVYTPFATNFIRK
jgi:hypothetical protein